MATNANEDDKSKDVVDDDKEVTEEDLRDLKYGSEEVETSKEEDETTEAEETEKDSDDTGEGEGQTDDQAEEEEETSPEFVKQFPNIKGDTPEEYAKNLEIAYNNSTAEFKRLRDEQTKDTGDEGESQQQLIDTSDITSLYAKQKMDEEIMVAYSDFSKKYSQVSDPVEYNKFTNIVAELSNTILQSEKRLAPPSELYTKSAVILGWQAEDVTDKTDKVREAAKDGAATSRTASVTKSTTKSKVTDDMIRINRKMYPGKSDTEIRKELEPFVT